RIIETARVPVIEYWRGLGTELSQEDLDTLFTFLSHGSKQVILLWTERGFDQTPEELARKVGTIVDNAVAAFLPKTEI
ncbi:MAG: TetR-like C-terminal domain-containing protein, partial [Acutalibacteraceae bacterium]|nr:TetR-like C-terminal domain-containing protein [Acutalibacteraceae bacterium]